MPYPTWQAGQRVTAGQLASMLPLDVLKGADTPRSSTTTMANDPDLVASVLANASYHVEAYIAYSQNVAAGASTGIKIGWAVPSGASLLWTSHGTDGVTSTTGHDVTANAAGGTRSLPANGATAMSAFVTGSLIVGGTAGSLAFQWAQATSSATSAIVKLGSWVRLRRVA